MVYNMLNVIKLDIYTYMNVVVIIWRDWRDYMNEDSGVMIVRVYGACVFLNYFPINKSGSTHIGPMVIWTRVCEIVCVCVSFVTVSN